tara:strand:+ start:426 stop:1007 length:582 start_codon:yes stop_codon:yes gene_type:complete
MSKAIILKIIFALFILSLLTLAIAGIFSKPRPNDINLQPQRGESEILCDKVPTQCNTDKDCLNTCIDNGEQFTCQTIGSNKICAIANGLDTCNQKFAGIPIWTGWGGLDVMNWECRCNESLWAGTPGCKKINPNICQGAANPNEAFKWPQPGNPTSNDCTCDTTKYVKMVRNGDGTPMCAPKNITQWYADTAA